MKYKHFSKEDIYKALKEIFGKNSDQLTYQELRERVMPGYHYKIGVSRDNVDPPKGERKVKAITGKGGVLMYLDVCEEKGIPAFIIATDIGIGLDEGWYTLADIKVKKK